MIPLYVGIDVGSVSTNLILLDKDNRVYEKLYIRTQGDPIKILREGLKKLKKVADNYKILGAGVTGSGRQLASVLTGADVIKNEITAHAVAAVTYYPSVSTIMEIGGQDSKIIFLKEGIVSDFAMNTVCAAGTGSFLDRQAARLEIPIEQFGNYALKSKTSLQIAGRCAVFAESDMIHKQQSGHSAEDIINGLCDALVRNYLNNLSKGKEISGTVLFQGGVAANAGIVKAFEKALNLSVIVPEHYDVMGAIGAALLAKEEVQKHPTSFHGFDNIDSNFLANTFECSHCPNKCEVVEIIKNSCIVARWGDRCGRWTNNLNAKNNAKQERVYSQN